MEKKTYQIPLTVDEQIENLKRIGLIIEDEKAAEDFLNDVSYFRLIKAYGLGLKKKNSEFLNDTTFNEIKELYLFNCKFRQKLFTQIEKVEINLRCRIANYFSCKYGNFGYEESGNFSDLEHHTEFLNEIKSEINRNRKAPFVKNFQQNYVDGKLPLYALIELFSFGTLSKFFKNMKNEDKKEVAATYGVNYKYFESWIEHIAFVRNICAHYGRLYNVNLAKTPMLYKQYRQLGISSMRVYATLLCLKHILPNDRHWTEFVDYLKILLDRYSEVKIDNMGFPEKWEEYLIK